MSLDIGGGLDLPTVPRRESLREQIAHALRAAMVAGEMRSGMVYSAPTLAAQFGVSPTPVREAMLDLAKEGLVESVRNKGFRVMELSDRELDEITQIRELIEVPMIGRLAGTLSDEDVARLRAIAEEIIGAAERGEILDYIDADRRFHLGLLALTGNAHLVEVVRDLRNRARLYGVSRLAERGELTPSGREHLTLLNLIAQGDADGAERLMRNHLGHVRADWA